METIIKWTNRSVMGMNCYCLSRYSRLLQLLYEFRLHGHLPLQAPSKRGQEATSMQGVCAGWSETVTLYATKPGCAAAGNLFPRSCSGPWTYINVCQDVQQWLPLILSLTVQSTLASVLPVHKNPNAVHGTAECRIVLLRPEESGSELRLPLGTLGQLSSVQ